MPHDDNRGLRRDSDISSSAGKTTGRPPVAGRNSAHVRSVSARVQVWSLLRMRKIVVNDAESVRTRDCARNRSLRRLIPYGKYSGFTIRGPERAVAPVNAGIDHADDDALSLESRVAALDNIGPNIRAAVVQQREERSRSFDVDNMIDGCQRLQLSQGDAPRLNWRRWHPSIMFSTSKL